MNIPARCVAAAFLATAAVLAAGDARAQGQTWQVTAGDWSLASNWGGTLPGASDTAYIVNGGTANVTQLGETCGTLSLGSGAGSGTVLMTAGNLTTTGMYGYEYVGDSGTGSFTQTGGSNSPFLNLCLGNNPGSNGAYNLSGGVLVSQYYGETIGNSGSGSFTQTGGTNLASGLSLGIAAGSSGTYTLSGSGLLSADGEYIGYYGSGCFNQSGGTHAVSGLYLGYDGGSGKYNLSGSGLLTAPYEYIGYSGNGSFTQTGGTHCVSSNLFVGNNYDGYGTYALSGSGLLVAASEYIGLAGSASFTQSGGTNSTTNLYLPASYGGTGAYNLSGGVLEVSGILETAAGTLNCSGGPATILAGSNTLVDLTGSVVNTASTSLYAGANSLVIVPSVSTSAAFHVFNNAGITYLTGSTLTVPAEQGFDVPTATITGPVNCRGTIAATAGGSINLTNGLSLSGTGQVALGSGGLTVNDPASGMSGGSQLAADYENIGYSGSGSFTQTGGTNAVSGQPYGGLYLGLNSGDSGTYTLSGSGRLSADYENIGYAGSGSFNQSGGTNAMSVGLSLGGATGSSGKYNLSGGLVSAGAESIGPGSFTQTRGTNCVSSALYVGNSYSYGTYALSGSGLLAAASEYIGSSGTCAFTQSGGTNSATDLYLSSAIYGESGAYNLSGGVLEVSGILETAGGTLNCSGGPATILARSNTLVDLTGSVVNTAATSLYAGANSLVIVPSVSTSAAFHVFDNAGITYLSGSTLTVPAGQGFDVPEATITGPVNCQGTIAATTGGTINLTNGLTLSGTGQVALGSGGLTVDSGTSGMSGGSQLSAAYEYIGNFVYTGNSGSASFTQTGGTNALSNLLLGNGGSGTYNLNGGLLTAGTESIGYSEGTGSFKQTGGTHCVSSALYVGWGISSGTYSLSGSGLLTSPTEYIGYSGTGSFTQSGGTNSVSNLYLATNGTRSSGTYNLSNGLLAAPIEYIGYSGSGSFTQSGGTNSVSDLYLAANGTGSRGTYNLSGSGLLSANQEYIDYSGSGSLTQSGGTNMAAYVSLSGRGSYLLSGGVLEINGGLATAGGILTGGPGAPGATIQASNSIVDLTGSVVNTASTSLSVGPNSLLIVPQGFSPAEFQSYANLGLTHTVGTTLTVPAGTGFGGWGTIMDPVVCQGTITATQGGAIYLDNGLQLSGTAQVNLGLGTLYVSDSTSLIGGQTLAAGWLVVGWSAPGTFTQTGGSNSLSSALYVGEGSYNLGGNGLLTAGTEYIGYYPGSGSFTQTGGTNSVSLFYVGNALVSGTYTLSGRGLLSAGTEYIGFGGSGWGGTGSFTQTGGTHSVSSTLYLGYNGSGTYSLSGSGLLSAGTEYIGFGGGGYGGTGSFTQTGGTHSVSVFYVGYENGTGTYNLSGSGLLSATQEYIGYSGSGSFTQTGGTNVAAYVNLSGGGSYLLSGGVLEVNGGLATAGGYLTAGGGTATATIQASNSIVDLTGSVVISPSTSLVVGPNSLLIVPQGFSPAEFQSYSNLGLTHTVGTTLTVPAGGGFGGWGTITDPVICQGTITAAAGDAINLTDGLQLSGTGNVNLSGGLLGLSGLTEGSGSAAISFSGGTIQAASSFSTGMPIVLSTPGGNADFDTNGNTLTLAGALSGPGGLQKIGEGLLILSGSNTYGGGTIVEAGTLQVLSSSALPDESSLTVGNASLFGQVTAASTAVAAGSGLNEASPVPEPGTLALLAVTVCAAAVYRSVRSRRRE